MTESSLSEADQKFLKYWEENRLREKKWMYQLMVGLPVGIIFAAPVLINFLLGRFWYKRADSVGVSQFNPMVLVVASALIVVFIALFNKKHKWDLNEQRYLELKSKNDMESKKI